MYALTPWGSQLREAIEALIRWSIPLMASGRGGDVFQPRWLAVALEALLRGRTAKPPAELGIEVAGLFMTLRIGKDGPHVTVEPDPAPRDDPRSRAGRRSSDSPPARSTIDQALSPASVHGDPRVLTRCSAGADMSRLLDEVLTTHGGLERWRAVTALTAHGRFGGLLRARFPENRMAKVTVRVQLAEQHAVFPASHKRTSKRCSIEATYGSRPAMAN